jgi:hypothetical protein
MKKSDGEILALIVQNENISYGINDSALADDRAQAIDYYLGEPFGNEVEGRSQVVSYDVQDTIEAALPQLLKIFVAGDRVVTFDPKGPEDADAADQETDYVNHLVMEKNEGFKIFYVWFKDALLSKNGYVKVYAEEEVETEEEEYTGLTDAQLALLVQDDNVEVLEHTAYPDPTAQLGQMMPDMMGVMEMPMLHDVKIRTTERNVEIYVKNVAPENMMVDIDVDGPSLKDANFVQHRESMPRAEVAEMFNYPLKKLNQIVAEINENFQEEAISRDIYDEEYDRTSIDDILVRDTYIRIDGELMRYVVIGNEIIYREKTDVIPFACITPMIMPHRHIGRSYADLTMDIQLIKSTLIRGQLDNMYLSNNGRYAISDRVNLDDMLTSRPGGVVRVQGEPGSAIFPLTHPAFPPTSFTMVEYMDSMKEKRTGVTAYNQGLDANSLNKTATGMNLIQNATQERLALVARTFAETGVKDLFWLVHRLVRTNQNKPDMVRLRNKWVEVDPREWKSRNDLSISVGLGLGNKDQQMVHLNNILQMQKEAIQVGLTSPDKIYNALAKLTQNAGFKNPEEFWTNPMENPMPQGEPQPDPAEQMIQGQLMVEQAKAQAQLEQERVRSQNDIVIEREKIAAQMELERFKAQLKAETDLAIAQIKAQMDAQKQIAQVNEFGGMYGG